MKITLIISAALSLCLEAMATGYLSQNSSQSGFLYFTNGGYAAQTNTFVPAFTYAPAFVSYLISNNTNALPLTNVVTATNYVVYLSSTAGAGLATNATVAWTANAISTQIQYGSQVVAAATVPTNVVFATPFVSTPTITVASSATNGWIAVSSVTATSFNLTTIQNATVYWTAIGPCAARAQSGPNGTEGVITH